MRRSKTLAASIMSLIASVIFAGVYNFLLFLIFNLLFSFDGSMTIFNVVMTLLPSIISLLIIILNACIIPLFNKSVEQYERKKGLVIATIVFNFIFAVLCGYNIATASEFSLGLLAYGALAFVMLISGALYIVDLKQNGHVISQSNSEATE